MTRNRIAFALGFTALTPITALAQESFLLDEIVASPGLLPIEISRTGASVEVLDGARIAEGDQQLARTLDRLPGLSLARNGGLGGFSSLSIRGLPNRYIGLRIDGIDYTDPSSTQTAFNFGTLTKGTAGRVEVLKGAQSALYGSNAIAGVVDITTWRPEDLGFSGEAEIEAGSYDTYSGTLRLGQATERGEMAMTLSRVETDGFPARTSDDEDDGFDQTLLTLFGAYEISENLRLGFSALYSDSTAEFDRSTFDPTGELDETRQGVRAFAEFDLGAVENELSVFWMETERFDEGGFTEEFIGERTKIEYLGSTELNADLTLAFGADWTEETAELDGTDYDADNGAIFGEAQYAASDALDLSLALRYDTYSDFDDELSGRAALAWRLRDDVIIRGVLGTGYRAPSLYERFGPFTAPDIDLEPESSQSAEIGIEKLFARNGYAKATLFQTEIDDLIDYDFATLSYNQVPGTTRTKGVELSGRYALSDAVAILGNYTYTDADGPDGRVLRVPRHDLNLGLEASFADRWNGYVALQYVADRWDTNEFPAPPSSIEDYTTVDIGVGYDVTEAAQLYLRVENLFDEEYEPLRGYNASERAFYVGLRATF